MNHQKVVGYYTKLAHDRIIMFVVVQYWPFRLGLEPKAESPNMSLEIDTYSIVPWKGRKVRPLPKDCR